MSDREQGARESRGLFITLEGIDGSGKSTQARRLVACLQACGRGALHTREPGGTPLGERLRQIVLDPARPAPTPLAEALLMAADRAQHVAEVVRPALAGGRTVVCERYVDSSLAYQGYGAGVDLAVIRRINEAATGGLTPDLTLLLDMPAASRWQAVRRPDRIEALGQPFLEKVREGFLALAAAAPQRVAVVAAAGRPPADIAAEIVALVWARFWPGEPPPPVAEQAGGG